MTAMEKCHYDTIGSLCQKLAESESKNPRFNIIGRSECCGLRWNNGLSFVDNVGNRYDTFELLRDDDDKSIVIVDMINGVTDRFLSVGYMSGYRSELIEECLELRKKVSPFNWTK